MRLLTLLLLATCTLAAALAGGCAQDSDKPALRQLWDKVRPTSPQENVRDLVQKDADRRREAIEALSDKDWGRQGKYLEMYAKMARGDEDPLVRSAAIRALGRSGDAKYVPVLVAALGDDVDHVRWDAAAALDELPGPQAVDPLRRRAVEDSSKDVRIGAVGAMRHYAVPRVVTTLVRCLSDPNFTVRHRAHGVLVDMVGKDYGAAPDGWPDTAQGLRPVQRSPGKKPWWDWTGVTTSSTKPPVQPAGPGQAPPREKPAGAPEKAPRKPWWDWAGMTEKKKDPPPASAGPKQTESKAWWDWFGTRSRKTPPPSQPAPPAPSQPVSPGPSLPVPPGPSLPVPPPPSQPAPPGPSLPVPPSPAGPTKIPNAPPS